jgi:hypothetical protein
VRSDQRGVTWGHWLLPPERWFASAALERQRTHRTPTILRLEQNYGPEGIALLAAGVLLWLLGVAIAMVGVVVLFVSGGDGLTFRLGNYLLFAAMVVGVPAIVRAIQASYAGRRFRGDRPFVKRP